MLHLKKWRKIPALEIYHNTINDIIVFNGNRNKKGSLFLIAKGGEPRQAHQHLDGGTFMLKAMGFVGQRIWELMIMPYRDFGTDVLTDNVGSISVITIFPIIR